MNGRDLSACAMRGQRGRSDRHVRRLTRRPVSKGGPKSLAVHSWLPGSLPLPHVWLSALLMLGCDDSAAEVSSPEQPSASAAAGPEPEPAADASADAVSEPEAPAVGEVSPDGGAFQGAEDAATEPDAPGAAQGTDLPTASVTGSAGCGKETYPEGGSKTIEVGGAQRDYAVALPSSYDPDRPYRVVFAWHGLFGTAAMTARSWFGLRRYAEDSAIFIAGQAAAGNQGSWAIRSDQDTDYVQAILDWASESYCIDRERVFSVGVSNGGMMANIVGCQMGDVFRATAPIAGGGPRGYAITPCKGKMAVWITHGNRDNNVPFSYGEASRDYWIRANGCSGETTAVSEHCLEYRGCDEGYPVQFCEHDGGHTVPGFAAEEAWRFFAQF